jgi:hypothetical protein
VRSDKGKIMFHYKGGKRKRPKIRHSEQNRSYWSKIVRNKNVIRVKIHQGDSLLMIAEYLNVPESILGAYVTLNAFNFSKGP